MPDSSIGYSQYHTDQFLVEMFHNYAFKECISVEKLKLWLLILKKTLFNDHTYKSDIGQHFHKSEKNPPGRRHCHKTADIFFKCR